MADVQPTSDQYADEQWKPVPGREGAYEASDMGRVRSLDMIVHRKDGISYQKRGRVLRPATHPAGHKIVMLKGRDFRYIHRLVLEAFVGPCPDGMEALHGNGDPADNRLANLRYGTRSDNMFDLVKHGGHRGVQKMHCPRGHLLMRPNLVNHMKNPRRECLACARAYGYARYHGILDKLQAVSDSYYEAIMRDAQHPAA